MILTHGHISKQIGLTDLDMAAMADSSLVVVLAGDWTYKQRLRRKADGRNVLWPEVLEQSPVVSDRLSAHGLSYFDS